VPACAGSTTLVLARRSRSMITVPAHAGSRERVGGTAISGGYGGRRGGTASASGRSGYGGGLASPLHDHRAGLCGVDHAGAGTPISLHDHRAGPHGLACACGWHGDQRAVRRERAAVRQAAPDQLVSLETPGSAGTREPVAKATRAWKSVSDLRAEGHPGLQLDEPGQRSPVAPQQCFLR
jgi:hypothetical protein